MGEIYKEKVRKKSGQTASYRDLCTTCTTWFQFADNEIVITLVFKMKNAVDLYGGTYAGGYLKALF